MSTWNSNIPQYVDGTTQVNAATFNANTAFLAGRDQFLFDQLNNYADKTVLVSFNNPIANNYLPGTPVYFETSSGTAVLTAAQAGYGETVSASHLIPNNSAFVFGLVKTVYSGAGSLYYGDTYVHGLVQGLDLTNILDSESYTGNAPAPGPLYLSSREPGKLTTIPSAASVFVGYVVSATSIFLAPNIDSLNQLYFNYKLYLNASVAGTGVLTGSTWSISHVVSSIDYTTTDLQTKTGWVNASDAVSVYGMTAPTNAVFYYNVPTQAAILADSTLSTQQKKDAILLKTAIPSYPAAYTMLFANGVLQVQNSTDFANGAYIINSDGIWWTLNQNNYQPWQASGYPLVLQLMITKLNPELSSSIVTSLTSTNDWLQITDQVTGQPAEAGALNLSLNLPVTLAYPGSTTGYAVQNLVFDQPSSSLITNLVPVINSVVAGPGLVATLNNGALQLSLSNFSLSGEVEDIEPEEADFVYKGLHSYLRLKNPALNQRVGFVGKFKLPTAIPAGLNLNISLQAFADSSTAPVATVPFVFEYALSKVGGTISTALTSNVVPINYYSSTPVFSSNNLSIVMSDPSTNAVFFQIPAASLVAGAYVNFRISRISTSANPSVYTGGIAVLGVNWIMQ